MCNFPDKKRWKPSLSKSLFFTEKVENKTSSLIHYSVDPNSFFCQILHNSGWNFNGTLWLTAILIYSVFLQCSLQLSS